MTLQHLRSSTANKRPTPAAMSDGQLAMNTNLASPGLFLKDSNGDLVKVGPVHVGTTAPNATPAVGGQAGNSKGEQWLDTTGGVYVFKIYDGTAWRSETGTFVDVNGDTMTGALGIIAGSAAAPGLFFSGDTNTGIYSPGADQVAVATNGTGRLFVDATGNVGIGASPSGSKLEVNGGSIGAVNAAGADIKLSFDVTGVVGGAIGFNDSGTTNAYGISDNTAYVGIAQSFPLAFSTTGQERLRITPAGLVGIGTSSPNEALHIASGGARISSSLIGGGASSLGLDYESSNARFISYGPDVSTQTGLIFLTGNSTASTTIERLRITAAGNVGIGTTSPSDKLEARGGAVVVGFSDNTTRTNKLFAGFGYETGGTLYGNVSIRSSYDNTNNSSTLNFHTASGAGADTERARIDSSGRLLVGTSSARSNFRVGVTNYEGTVQHESGSQPFFTVVGGTNGTSGPYLMLGHQRSGAVGGNTVLSSGDELGTISFHGSDGTNLIQGASVYAVVDGTPGTNDIPTRLVFSTTADGASAPTERMRINQAGVAEFNKPGVLNTWLQVYNGNSSQDLAFVSSDSAGNEWHFGRKRTDGYFYVVRQTGTGMYMDTNSWVATSDQRAKQNIADIESTIDAVKALKPSRFNWKTDGTADVGFIAQQVQTLIPEAVVDSGKPEAMLGITQDKLLPFVVKALQEAIAKIETLETRLTAAGIE